MLKLALAAIAAVLLTGGTAFAQTCGPQTFTTLFNGTTADATQVRDNFNCILNSPKFAGPVGIGKSTPRTSLDIGNATSFPADLIGLYDNGPSVRYGIGIDVSATQNGMVLYSGDRGFTFKSGALPAGVGSPLMTISSAGAVGIGTTSPTATLQVQGNGLCSGGLRASYQANGGNSFDVLQGSDNALYFCYAGSAVASISTAGSYSQISDGRLKTNINPLSDSNGLAAINRLRPVAYSFRRENSGSKHYGFVAQEVQQVFPELVASMALPAATGSENQVEDAKSVDYTGLIAPLVKAVQQLKAQNDAQEQEIQVLKAQVAALGRSG